MAQMRSKISYFSGLDEVKLAVETANLTANLREPEFLSIKAFSDATELASQAYSQALSRAAKGDREMIAKKDQMKAALLQSLVPLGTNFDALADGNKVLFEKAGMPSTKAPVPAPALTTPATPKLSAPAIGQIKSVTMRQPGTRGVAHMISPDPITAGSWTTYSGTTVRHTFTNLKPGKHWVKIVMSGAKNTVESEIASYMAQ